MKSETLDSASRPAAEVIWEEPPSDRAASSDDRELGTYGYRRDWGGGSPALPLLSPEDMFALESSLATTLTPAHLESVCEQAPSVLRRGFPHYSHLDKVLDAGPGSAKVGVGMATVHATSALMVFSEKRKLQRNLKRNNCCPDGLSNLASTTCAQCRVELVGSFWYLLTGGRQGQGS